MLYENLTRPELSRELVRLQSEFDNLRGQGVSRQRQRELLYLLDQLRQRLGT
jgi:hypothetical protein